MKRNLTPQALFDWADTYARKKEAAGAGTSYPTLRQAARHFGCRLDEIELTADEGVEDGYLGVGVGYGNSVGHYTIERQGDYLVEAYR